MSNNALTSDFGDLLDGSLMLAILGQEWREALQRIETLAARDSIMRDMVVNGLINFCRDMSTWDTIALLEQRMLDCPRNALLQFCMAWMYRGQEQLEEAIDLLNDIPMDSIWSDIVLVELGNFYADRARPGDLDNATRSWRRAIEVNPDNHIAHYNLADHHYNLGLLEKGVLHCQNALDAAKRKNIVYPKAHYQMGVFMYELGRKQDAVREFSAVLSIEEAADAYFGRGLAYFDLRQLDLAESDWLRAYEIAEQGSSLKVRARHNLDLLAELRSQLRSLSHL